MLVVDICFVLLYILIPIFSCVLLKTVGLSIFRLSIPSVVIISLFGYAYIGILFLYFRWDAYRDYLGVNDKGLLLRIFLYTSMSIIGIIAGYYVTYCVLKNNNNSSARAIILKPVLQDKLAGLFVLICCSVVLFLYIKKIPQIALFVAIMEGSNAGGTARSAMGNSFTGKYHWYSVFMHDVLNIISFSFFSLFIQRKKKIFIIIIFIISSLLAIFASIMSTQKGPVAFLIIGYWFVFILVKKNGNIGIKNTLSISLGVIGLLVLAYKLFFGYDEIFLAITSVFSRAFTGQIDPAYFYLEYFPAHHDYLMGLSFPNPGHILPYTPFQLTKEIMDWKFPELASRGITGSAPTVFWGEMYANFGTAGVLLPPFFVGMFIYVIHYLINKLKPNAFVIGTHVWLMLHYKNLALSGLSNFLIDFYLVVVFLVYTLVMFFAGNGRIKLKEQKYGK